MVSLLPVLQMGGIRFIPVLRIHRMRTWPLLCLRFMQAFIGSFAQFGFIVLVTWYLAVFFLVPVFAGSIVYSYCRILHLTSRLSSHQQQPQCGASDSGWPDVCQY
jgi:hypothetical protein